MTKSLGLLAATALLLVSASRLSAQYDDNPALPPIPSVEAPLHIDVIYPTLEMTKPNVGRNFIFGTVGTGGATLTINGDDVSVASNGAFLGFLPMPRNGVYALVAEKGEERDTLVFSFAEPGEAPDSPPQVVNIFDNPELGIVTSGADTVASGSGIAYGAPTQWADREWFFPKGTRFPVLEHRGNHVRIDLAGETAWVEKEYVTVTSDVPKVAEAGLDLTLTEADYWTDLRVPVYYTPFKFDLQKNRIEMVFYNALSYDLEKQAGADTRQEPMHVVTNPPNSLVKRYEWKADLDKEKLYLTIDLRQSLWGFKAFYDESGGLVVRIRRPNAIDAEKPLRGMRIMVDAGHPPRGATGPTGLTEADANLAIALAMEKKLKERGASVVMTRRDSMPLFSGTDVSAELTARVDYAVQQNADILISVHNNGFSDGVNPFERNGTETYFYHTFAGDLAEDLLKEMVEVTGVPELGFKQRSLALARPTWMPAVLTESLYMMHPQQEAALKDPAFVDKLAEAHIRGLEKFVRDRRR